MSKRQGRLSRRGFIQPSTGGGGRAFDIILLYTAPLDAFQVSRIVSTMFIRMIGGIGRLTGTARGLTLAKGLFFRGRSGQVCYAS